MRLIYAALAVTSLAAGVAGVFAYQAWKLDTEPRRIFVRGVEAAAFPAGDRVLTVAMETDPQPSCFRVGIHILYRDGPDGIRHYAPLSPAVNGLGFSATMATKFTVSMNLPADIAAGDWQYVSRTVFLCPMWLGLVRFYTEQSAPLMVGVPEVKNG